MVQRVYVEKKPGLDLEACALLEELRQYAGLKKLAGLRLLNRYDVEGLDAQAFEQAVAGVLSEAPLDLAYAQLPQDAGAVLALEYLPGQFDQRADSASQCIQLLQGGERPRVRTARLYLLQGELSAQDVAAAQHYLLNPVESRQAALDLPQTLALDAPRPQAPAVLEGFCTLDDAGLALLQKQRQLAMDLDDLRVCQSYFAKEGRQPTQTELAVIDTYWSDHCRHTTFLTQITAVQCDDPVIAKTLADYQRTRRELGLGKPCTLMDVATIAARALKRRGLLPQLEETEENNACTIRISADTTQGPQDWLLFFKNETHNHPTEIEPFGGAATCIGGAIRDPLSARAYVYAAMRVTGAGDPTQPVESTLAGKLPQRKIVTGAAAGYASYGNQIGLATGCVRELYHPGYAAKRLECGAVLGAAQASHVRRERPQPGDVVILVGGRTGRDGCGGATGSSQAHTTASVDVCAAQVQKGNAPEERKLQRLFANPQAAAYIKRCNDFGAGGVAVAIGELAPGLDIDLDRVPVKYEGLGATELAISESQERMAVVVAAQDAAAFMALAQQENLEATPVAAVTAQPRLVMRWHNQTVVDIARAFLDENGAPKAMNVVIEAPKPAEKQNTGAGFAQRLRQYAAGLNGCAQRGLIERFDSTIGAGSVLLPLGGSRQLSVPCAMVHTLPIPGGTNTASYMAFGFDPYLSAQSPYHGAYLAVVEAVANVVAAGAPTQGIYLTNQEFFPKPGQDPKRWGLPLAALLGAYRAQMELGIAAIGGKDSMSGSFEQLDVPPTFISFAVAAGRAQDAKSPEFKRADSRVVWLRPQVGADGLPTAQSLQDIWQTAAQWLKGGQAISCCSVGAGGAAAAILRMAQGNGIGFAFDDAWQEKELFDPAYGSLILEMDAQQDEPSAGQLLGVTLAQALLRGAGEEVALEAITRVQAATLAEVFPTRARGQTTDAPPVVTHRARTLRGVQVARPRVLIPAFPGTNCEMDTARAFERAGAIPHVLVVRNLTAQDVKDSVARMAAQLRQAQILLIPGGFSGGDEPDGSAKLIAAFLRSAPVREALADLLDRRQGLAGGICNGFQALIKLGLVPYGRMLEADSQSPTLTYNAIGRHQSRLVRVRVGSNLSPWFCGYEVGQCYTVPISHGEGRLVCSPQLLAQLVRAGQVASQYADAQGNPSMDIDDNPSGSAWAVEALTSPDGRVMGRMGHSERMLEHLYKNVPNTGEDPLFISAVRYYG